MGWRVSMKDEREKFVGDNGDYVAEIQSIKLVSAEESKSGNPYFEWLLTTERGSIEVRTTLLKGKRWLLKQMLLACGIESNPDDPDKKYEFEPEQVIGQTIVIKIVNNDKNTYTNNKGELVTNTKAEVKQIKPYKIETEQELQEQLGQVHQEPPKREPLSEKLKEKLPKTKKEMQEEDISDVPF